MSEPRYSRLWLEYLGVLIGAAVLYGLTVAPGPLWQDNGMAQVRVLQHDYTGELGLALAHPLFYLLTRAFQGLPPAESALKTNLVAAVFSAVTVANFYLLLRWVLVGRSTGRFAALIGTVSLALAHTFWQHAALAEVYSVSTAILTLELVLLVRFFQTKRRIWFLGAWLFNGLECSNHMLAVVTLAPVVLWSLVLVRDGTIKLRWFWPAAGLWLLGCLPYEVLGGRAVLGGMPLGEVIHSMLFGQYQREVLNVGVSAGLIVTTLGVIALNFLTPNLWLIPAGMVRAKQMLPPRLVLLFGLLTGCHLLFAMRYPVRDQYTFFIMSVLFLAFWLGIGAAWFVAGCSRRRWWVLALACLPPLGYAVVPSVVRWRNPTFAHPPIPYRQEATYFFWPWKTGYDGPERLVGEVFALAGPDAVILADSTAIRPFQYAQLAWGRRPDVEVTGGLYPDLPESERIGKLVNDLKTRQFFVVRPYPGYAPRWLLEHFAMVPEGPIYRVVGRK